MQIPHLAPCRKLAICAMTESSASGATWSCRYWKLTTCRQGARRDQMLQWMLPMAAWGKLPTSHFQACGSGRPVDAKKKQNLLLNTCPPFSPQPQTSLLILIIFIIQSFSSSPKPHPRSKCDPPPRTLSHPSFLSQIAAARVPAPLPSSYKRLVWTTTQERYATRRLITAPFFSA